MSKDKTFRRMNDRIDELVANPLIAGDVGRYAAEREKTPSKHLQTPAAPEPQPDGTSPQQPATIHGPAPRPTIPMTGGDDAGTLLERMRAEERY